jgi:decaprenylphospho-beta-D-erythro-pentofuranosid-2-ulose 2-reductase
MLTGRQAARPAAANGQHAGRFRRVLLLGGTSEIGLAILAALPVTEQTEVLLAGRDEERIRAAAKLGCQLRTIRYDATDIASHAAFAADIVTAGPIDLVVSAAGVLTSQEQLEASPDLAGQLIETNFTGHVSTLLALAGHMRDEHAGTIVILSSIAAIRPRKANFVYGAAKAGLDAFARGLADSLHGTGVRVLLVRPGFVIGRMTAGMDPAPLATTPDRVGAAVAAALAGTATVVWVPPGIRLLAVAARLLPRPLWRRLRR